ncbi:MAG: hypothetical protein MEPRV_02120 [Providencia sp.]|nr:hypothetical protein RB151_025210 [Providencia rettgeri]
MNYAPNGGNTHSGANSASADSIFSFKIAPELAP